MTHDIVVVGGGPGGYATAFRAAARGLDVAVVEQDKVGGTCLHRGCIPSKAVLHVAEVLTEIDRADVLGLKVSFGGIDGDNLDAFRQGVVDRMYKGLAGLVKARCTLHAGRGRIVDAGTVEVVDDDGARTLVEGRHVVLATGSVPRVLPSVEVDGDVVQTSDQALWFRRPPAHAVVVGAGAIGMEFASMWAPMGSEVTVVEALERVLPLEDVDVSTAVERSYRRRGIDVLTRASLTAVERSGDGAAVTVATAEGDVDLDADLVLIAVGRGPNTSDTGAADLGVLDDRGFAVTDDYGATPVDGVWAVGDVRPTLALAHAAFAEGFVVADRIAGVDDVVPVDHVHTPRVTYCHPQVASVGLTEAEAVDRHGADAVTTATATFKANAQGIVHASDGFVKSITLSEGAGRAPGATGELLGVHVVGPYATDLIGEATLATAWGALPEELAAITHAHPTLYEAMGEAFQSLAGLPFHGH